MDKDRMKKEIYAANFKTNNGKVLRMINILRTTYNKLSGVGSALEDQGVSEWEFLDCLNYLSQAGYIHLRLIGKHTDALLADTSDYRLLEANLTAHGIRLLAGGVEDPVVEI